MAVATDTTRAPRRQFLKSLVTLPLIGGGVTLIGRPAAAVPLVQAAALPTLDDPRQRARYAWEAFSAAMRDLTADAHGWRVEGGERQAFGRKPGGAYCVSAAIRMAEHRHRTCPEPFYSTSHEEIAGIMSA